MASAKPHVGRLQDSENIRRAKRALDYTYKHLNLVAVAVGAALMYQNVEVLQQVLFDALQLAHASVAIPLIQVSAILLLAVSTLVWLAYQKLAQRPTYLVDYVVHRPDPSWRISREGCINYVSQSKEFPQESAQFMLKVLTYSGLGNDTSFPPWIKGYPQDTSIERSREEFDAVVIASVRELLDKTGVSPSQVGVVVVNCSLFCPTPSLCAQIINAFNMSRSTLSYNLGGMGCSASPIAVDLARRMLSTVPNTYALVVSTESITRNMYKGTQRSMLVPNTLFRVGGAALLLSNKRTEAWRAKYKLHTIVRTTMSADDDSYHCVWEQEDSDGNKGVKLSRDLPKTAGRALNANLATIGPKVLPVSEKLAFAANLVARKLLRMKHLKPYVPDFQAAVDHICIHTGGRGVIDGIQGELGLSDQTVEPSRASLYRYGNVSSSSCWYVLSFIESFRGVRKGDRVLQLSFGSGFKCNSAVWVANKAIKDKHYAWEGFDLAAMYQDLSILDFQHEKLKKLLDASYDADAAAKQQIAQEHIAAFRPSDSVSEM